MDGYRDNSGVLFKNGRKQTDKSPDYTGEITIEGRRFELSAWIRDGRNGKFMTLAARPPRMDRRPSQREIDRGEEQRRRAWNP